MNNTHNKQYLEFTLFGLNRDLEDLEEWSINNGDMKLDEIHQIKELVDLLIKQLTK